MSAIIDFDQINAKISTNIKNLNLLIETDLIKNIKKFILILTYVKKLNILYIINIVILKKN